MKALVVDRFGRADDVRFIERPTPRPGARDVLVRVRATSVNPIDWKLRDSPLRYAPFGVPRVGGFDVSGEVVERGPSVSSLEVGDEVFGMLAAMRGGANADLVATRADMLAQKPSALTHAEAAAIPLAGLTAWQAFEHARLARGDRVLVVGASGGVGAFAVQLAHAKGAHVTGVSSSRNVDFVRSLGADAVVAYDRGSIVGDYDVIFDAVGVGSFFGFRVNLGARGRFVTTLANVANVVSFVLHPRRSRLVVTRPRGADLAKLAALVDEGRLRVHLEETYALADVARAYARSRTGRVVGKLAVVIASAVAPACLDPMPPIERD